MCFRFAGIRNKEYLGGGGGGSKTHGPTRLVKGDKLTCVGEKRLCDWSVSLSSEIRN